MIATIQDARPQSSSKRLTGSDIKTLPPGTHAFGEGLYLLVSPKGTRSWQVRYHLAGKHQAKILGRWPEVSISEARDERRAMRLTVRAGGDPAKEHKESKAQRMAADAATVRVIGEEWCANAQHVVGRWSPYTALLTRQRLERYVYPKLGDRPIGRISTQDIQSLVGDIAARYRSQAVQVRLNLQSLFDYALSHDHVTVNPVRKIAKHLPTRIAGDVREKSRAHVATIEEARTVLQAVEATKCSPFAKLAHRLIALTAVRKMEGIAAQWSEVSEGPDGWTWMIPAARMKGKLGKKREHIIPLSPQAADVFRAARALAMAMGITSPAVFPGDSMQGSRGLGRHGINELMGRALPEVKLEGRHTVHGWRSTFYTIMKERDYRDEIIIDAMLAHLPARPSHASLHYDGSQLVRNGKEAQAFVDRRRLACTWADLLLLDAPSAFALTDMIEARDNDNVIPFKASTLNARSRDCYGLNQK